MNLRPLYASIISIFALLGTFFTITYWGLGLPEPVDWIDYAYGVLLLLAAALSIWAAVQLWRKADAVLPTILSLASVALACLVHITEWLGRESITVPFIVMVLSIIMLGALAIPQLRSTLKGT